MSNPFEHPDAQRRFRIMTNVEELQRALDFPWEKWTVFLHPEQQQWVERDYTGPARISGSAGTGKTLLAKAVATESEANFIAIRGPELISKWVGDSEKIMRELFRKARMSTPCIIFIDELDAMGSKRTFSQFGSGEGNTTQNQLLVAMDGLSDKAENIIVIGATNAGEDILDPALLRPGL